MYVSQFFLFLNLKFSLAVLLGPEIYLRKFVKFCGNRWKASAFDGVPLVTAILSRNQHQLFHQRVQDKSARDHDQFEYLQSKHVYGF